jgi:PTH1 family peptidyl-tRNA hydrolase
VRVELLIAGLGNPGPEYDLTRHNAGQMVVDALARRHGFARAKRGFDGRYGAGVIEGREVGMLVPTTYMNRSGRSVAGALRSLGLAPAQLLVMHDHIDLPFGRLRLAEGGGSGGHNGLKSISGLVGPEYCRLRIGVGRPLSTDPDVVADYVLDRFAEPRAEVEELIERAADAAELWVREGAEAVRRQV